VREGGWGVGMSLERTQTNKGRHKGRNGISKLVKIRLELLFFYIK
jgi:hypothetical protein